MPSNEHGKDKKREALCLMMSTLLSDSSDDEHEPRKDKKAVNKSSKLSGRERVTIVVVSHIVPRKGAQAKTSVCL